MRIQHAGQQKIGAPTLQLAGLVHQFMGIDDADRARDYAQCGKAGQFGANPDVRPICDIDQRPQQHRGLHRPPDDRQPTVQGHGRGWRRRVCIRTIVTCN